MHGRGQSRIRRGEAGKPAAPSIRSSRACWHSLGLARFAWRPRSQMPQAHLVNNIATKPLRSEVTESSAGLLAIVLPLPEIALGFRCRGPRGAIEPTLRPPVEVTLDSLRVARCGMDRCEVKSHRFQQSEVQFGACILSQFDLLGIRADTPDDELVLHFEKG